MKHQRQKLQSVRQAHSCLTVLHRNRLLQLRKRDVAGGYECVAVKVMMQASTANAVLRQCVGRHKE